MISMYTIDITNRAERELKKMDGSIRRVALMVILHDLPKFPMLTEIKELTNYGDDAWRKKFRKDWRVLFYVHDDENTIEVFKIGHRKDVYK